MNVLIKTNWRYVFPFFIRGNFFKRHRPHSPCPSCGSYTSFDSDTGLESMASTQTDSWPRSRKATPDNRHHRTSGLSGSFNNNCIESSEMEHLRFEINKLRAEKHEWSRSKQDMVSCNLAKWWFISWLRNYEIFICINSLILSYFNSDANSFTGSSSLIYSVITERLPRTETTSG